ncbi:nuclear pore complex protein Nup54-like isoform X2 [Gordionus sp. m RMFG-2023]|uniref:nuclear pore complex protein Nup54-like isoform X2 n=1 Tax=Gordionus sp. m RMFG-2023 TaxID=3053472 RepID=UPI0031FE12A6
MGFNFLQPPNSHILSINSTPSQFTFNTLSNFVNSNQTLFLPNVSSLFGSNSQNTLLPIQSLNTNFFRPITNMNSLTGTMNLDANMGSDLQLLYQSLSTPVIFNDTRDQILQQWNQLQAIIGNGKGYYSNQTSPFNYTFDGLCTKFKAVFYNTLVTEKNEDGLMLVICDKPYEQIVKFKSEFSDSFNKIIGNKPNVTVDLINIREIGNKKCCVTLIVNENLSQGGVRKATCQELVSYFNLSQTNSNLGSQNGVKSQLAALDIDNIIPKIGPTPQQIQVHLDNPPSNIDPKIWAKAIQENPDPAHLIPIPVLGFNGLYTRLSAIVQENDFQKLQLNNLNLSLSQQHGRLLNIANKIKSMTRKYKELKHRFLQVKCVQDSKRLYNIPIQIFEVQLRAKLESLYNELNSNDQIQVSLIYCK